MQRNFWDERFSSREYVYGTQANDYVVEKLANLKPGKILFPAEGEGRNAVYAATLGWDVHAFDTSIEGIKKATKLAEEKGVSINYQLDSFDTYAAQEQSFDAIVLIFAHSQPRKLNHRRLLSLLKKGGVLILEGFSKDQLKYNSGGPASIEMLFSREELFDDFSQMSKLEINQKIRKLNEGEFHRGEASTIQLYGVK